MVARPSHRDPCRANDPSSPSKEMKSGWLRRVRASSGRSDRVSRTDARIAAAGVLFALILSTSCGSSSTSGVGSPTAVAAGISTTAPIAAAASTSSAATAPTTAAPTQAPTTPAPTTPPPPPPTPPPPPAKTVPPATANTCGAPSNPWGYTFCAGSFISAPPSNFCSYFNCIASFWNGRGYVMECGDLTFGKSGGISGSCSGHGGNYRALYAP